jgi:two-component system response regulator FixJ
MAYKTALSFLDAAPGVSAGCVLLDVRMPEMDGLELQARLNGVGCPLPVIVMTGEVRLKTRSGR